MRRRRLGVVQELGSYALVEVETGGATRSYGPFAVVPEAGEATSVVIRLPTTPAEGAGP